MSFRLPGLPWLALALAPSLLLADEPDTTTHVGLQLNLATPRQDLHDATTKTGVGGGLFFEKDLDPTWSVRTRFDYTPFGQGKATVTPQLAGYIPGTATQVSVDQTSLGAEVRLHPRTLMGAFFLFGASGTRMEFRSLGPDPAGVLPVLETKEKTSFKLGLSFGVGYQILPACSLTFRYATFEEDGTIFATSELGLGYRF